MKRRTTLSLSIVLPALLAACVEETTGQNIRLPASVYASLRGMPSAIFRSAYSVTTMPPSTRMPTAITMPNMTIMLIV